MLWKFLSSLNSHSSEGLSCQLQCWSQCSKESCWSTVARGYVTRLAVGQESTRFQCRFGYHGRTERSSVDGSVIGAMFVMLAFVAVIALLDSLPHHVSAFRMRCCWNLSFSGLLKKDHLSLLQRTVVRWTVLKCTSKDSIMFYGTIRNRHLGCWNTKKHQS